MYYRLVDAHTHLEVLGKSFSQKSNMAQKSSTFDQLRVEAWCNATSPRDWQDVKTMAAQNSMVRPWYGVHPWFVKDLPKGWYIQLEDLFKENAESVCLPIGLGEIGLDKAVRQKSFSLQKDIFRYQLDFAAERGLPVSIHCIRAWGTLLSIIEDSGISPALCLLHGFRGPREIFNHCNKQGFRISFGADSISNEDGSFYIVSCGENQIFIESDTHGGGPQYKAELETLYRTVAGLRECSFEDFVKQVERNASFYTVRTASRKPGP